MANSTINGLTFDEFANVISGEVTTTAATPPKMDVIVVQVTSPFQDETFKRGPTNIPIVARGNAATSKTGINGANKRVAHVCNFPDVVEYAIAKAGALGGQLVAAIRKGIQALLKALGFSPPANGFAAELKKIARQIKNALSFLDDINNFVKAFVYYAKKLGDLVKYILSLPKAIIAFFADCLKQALAILKAGYMDTIASATGAPNTESEIKSITESLNSIKQDVQKAVQTAQNVAALPATLTSALTKGTGISTTATAQDVAKLTSQLNSTGFSNYQQNTDTYQKA